MKNILKLKLLISCSILGKSPKLTFIVIVLDGGRFTHLYWVYILGSNVRPVRRIWVMMKHRHWAMVFPLPFVFLHLLSFPHKMEVNFKCKSDSDILRFIYFGYCANIAANLIGYYKI